MNFPSLKSARILNQEEMLCFRGVAACSSGCKSGFASNCKSGCSQGNNILNNLMATSLK